MKAKIQNSSEKKLGSRKFYVLGVACGVLAVISILLTIDVATSGVEVAKLEKEQSALSDQKRVLEESLVKNLSASQLQEKSLEMGFIKPANLVYVSDLPPVANLP